MLYAQCSMLSAHCSVFDCSAALIAEPQRLGWRRGEILNESPHVRPICFIDATLFAAWTDRKEAVELLHFPKDVLKLSILRVEQRLKLEVAIFQLSDEQIAVLARLFDFIRRPH